MCARAAISSPAQVVLDAPRSSWILRGSLRLPWVLPGRGPAGSSQITPFPALFGVSCGTYVCMLRYVYISLHIHSHFWLKVWLRLASVGRDPAARSHRQFGGANVVGATYRHPKLAKVINRKHDTTITQTKSYIHPQQKASKTSTRHNAHIHANKQRRQQH